LGTRVKDIPRWIAMEPYEQGGLDSLCGVYSIINAARKVVKINKNQALELFNKIIDFLDDEGRFKRVMLEGISLHDISQIINEIIKPKYPIESKAPFWHFPNISLKYFWDEMMDFCTEPNTAILIGVGGIHDHWTVVESIAENRIHLFDSNKIKRFERNRCSTQRTDKKRLHKLYPTHTYFLRRIGE
jgi:hypothetical protein